MEVEATPLTVSAGRGVIHVARALLAGLVTGITDTIAYACQVPWWQWLLTLTGLTLSTIILAAPSLFVVTGSIIGNVGISAGNFVFVDFWDAMQPVADEVLPEFNEAVEVLSEFSRALLFDELCPTNDFKDCKGVPQMIGFGRLLARAMQEYGNYVAVWFIAARTSVQAWICNAELLIEGFSAADCLEISPDAIRLDRLLNDPDYFYLEEGGTLDNVRQAAAWVSMAIDVALSVLDDYIFPLILFVFSLCLIFLQVLGTLLFSLLIVVSNFFFAFIFFTWQIDDDSAALSMWRNGTTYNFTSYRQSHLAQISITFFEDYDPVDLMRPDPATEWIPPGDPLWLATLIGVLEQIQDTIASIFAWIPAIITWLDGLICSIRPENLLDCSLKWGFCPMLFHPSTGIISPQLNEILDELDWTNFLDTAIPGWQSFLYDTCYDLQFELGANPYNCECDNCVGTNSQIEEINELLLAGYSEGTPCLPFAEDACCLTAGTYWAWDRQCFISTESQYTSIWYLFLGPVLLAASNPIRPPPFRCSVWGNLLTAPMHWALDYVGQAGNQASWTRSAVEDVNPIWSLDVYGFASQSWTTWPLTARQLVLWDDCEQPWSHGHFWCYNYFHTTQYLGNPNVYNVAWRLPTETLIRYPDLVTPDLWHSAVHPPPLSYPEGTVGPSYCRLAGLGLNPNMFSVDFRQGAVVYDDFLRYVSPAEGCHGSQGMLGACYSDQYVSSEPFPFGMASTIERVADALFVGAHQHAHCPDAARLWKRLKEDTVANALCVPITSTVYEARDAVWRQRLFFYIDTQPLPPLFPSPATFVIKYYLWTEYFRVIPMWIFLDAFTTDNYTRLCNVYILDVFWSPAYCTTLFAFLKSTGFLGYNFGTFDPPPLSHPVTSTIVGQDGWPTPQLRDMHWIDLWPASTQFWTSTDDDFVYTTDKDANPAGSFAARVRHPHRHMAIMAEERRKYISNVGNVGWMRGDTAPGTYWHRWQAHRKQFEPQAFVEMLTYAAGSDVPFNLANGGGFSRHLSEHWDSAFTPTDVTLWKILAIHGEWVLYAPPPIAGVMTAEMEDRLATEYISRLNDEFFNHNSKHTVNCSGTFHFDHILTQFSEAIHTARYGPLGGAILATLLQGAFGTAPGDLGPLCQFGSFGGTDCGSQWAWSATPGYPLDAYIYRAVFYAWSRGQNRRTWQAPSTWTPRPNSILRIFYGDLRNESKSDPIVPDGTFEMLTRQLVDAIIPLLGGAFVEPYYTDLRIAMQSMLGEFNSATLLATNRTQQFIAADVGMHPAHLGWAIDKTAEFCSNTPVPEWVCRGLVDALRNNDPFRHCVIDPYTPVQDCLTIYWTSYHNFREGAEILKGIDKFTFVGEVL